MSREEYHQAVMGTPKTMPHGKNHEGNTWGTVKEEIQNELGLFPFKGKEKDILGIPTKETHSICGK